MNDPRWHSRRETAYPLAHREITTPSGERKWLAECADLPYCVVCAHTEEEVLKKGREARDTWLQTAEALGIDPPAPESATEAKGQLELRVLWQTHQRLTHYASLLTPLPGTRTSFNDLVNRIVAERLQFYGFLPDTKKHTAFLNQLLTLEKQLRGKHLPSWQLNREKSYGKWVQRFPPHLHHALKVIADQQGVSMNLLIAILLAEAVILLDTLIALGERTSENTTPESPTS